MPKIELLGYLKGSRLDREGCKTVCFEFSASNAVEIAKLELMARDLKNHLPKLLNVKIEVIEDGKKEKGQTVKNNYDFT